MDKLPQKRIRHFDVVGHVHHLTFSCYQQMSLLTNDAWRYWLSESIENSLRRHGFILHAFVFMPNHVHLLVRSQMKDARIDKFLFGVKRPFSFRVKRSLQERADPLLRQLTIRKRPGKRVFRFWQAGPGHDRNLSSVERVAEAIHYIHFNPVKEKLCDSPDQWKWSSWRTYHRLGEHADRVLPHVDIFGR